MRNLSYLFLLASLVAYLLGVLVKVGVPISMISTKPVSILAFAGLNALIAAVFGVLSVGNNK